MAAASPTDTPAAEKAAELLQAAVVAHRYFIEDRTKIEIAAALGVSRFRVARLLDLARQAGIVEITVHSPLGIDHELSRGLMSAYGLTDARVIDDGVAHPDELMSKLGRAAAVMLGDLVSPRSVLGVSWGHTVRAVVDATTTLPECTIVQIAGGLPDRLEQGAGELVRRLAERTTASVYPLHAPLYVSDAITAVQLRGEQQIARTLAMFDRLSTVVFGVGSWSANSAIASVLGPEDRRHLERQGVVAEACGMFLTDDGAVVVDELAQKIIAISAKQLEAVPVVLAVAGGEAKNAAVRATLRSRLVSHLVTDRATAEFALNAPNRGGYAARSSPRASTVRAARGSGMG